MKSQKHLLSKLFISTLYLSAFTFWRRLCDRYTHEKRNLWTSITGSMMRKCWI